MNNKGIVNAPSFVPETLTHRQPENEKNSTSVKWKNGQ
jgi:hypothetical protein